MKNIAKMLLSGLFLLSTTSLIGQPYSPSPNGGPYNADFPNQNNFQGNRPGANILQWKNRFEDAVAASKETHKPILILFTGTTWCPACMRLEREVLNHPQLAADIGQKFIFMKVEIPDYTAAAIANSPYKPLLDRYGKNMSFPTMVIVDSEGAKLFVVNYQQDGARAYAKELLGKLQQYNGNLNTAAQMQAPNKTPSNSPTQAINGDTGSKDDKMDNQGYYIP